MKVQWPQFNAIGGCHINWLEAPVLLDCYWSGYEHMYSGEISETTVLRNNHDEEIHGYQFHIFQTTVFFGPYQ